VLLHVLLWVLVFLTNFYSDGKITARYSILNFRINPIGMSEMAFLIIAFYFGYETASSFFNKPVGSKVIIVSILFSFLWPCFPIYLHYQGLLVAALEFIYLFHFVIILLPLGIGVNRLTIIFMQKKK